MKTTTADRQVNEVKTPAVTTSQQLEFATPRDQSRVTPKASDIPPTKETTFATPDAVGSSKESAVANIKEPEDGLSGEPQQTRKV